VSAKKQTCCEQHKQKIEPGYGRLTQRTTTVYKKNLADFILDPDWAALIKTIIQVERSTDIFDTKGKIYLN